MTLPDAVCQVVPLGSQGGGCLNELPHFKKLETLTKKYTLPAVLNMQKDLAMLHAHPCDHPQPGLSGICAY